MRPAGFADSTAARRRAAVVSRVLAAIGGGWLFAWGFAVLALALGCRAGLGFEDAQTLAWLLVFLVYVATACWSVAARRLARVWGVLLAGAALMTGAGWWLMAPAA